MSQYPIILKDSVQVGVCHCGNVFYPIVTNQMLQTAHTEMAGPDDKGYAVAIDCDDGPHVIGGLVIPTLRNVAGHALGSLLSLYDADVIVLDKDNVYVIQENTCTRYLIEEPEIPQGSFDVSYTSITNKEGNRMVELVSCGMYVEDGELRMIQCDQEMGDIVIQMDAGPILLENVVVTEPRLLDESNTTMLQNLMDYYKADGIFGTAKEWAVICGNEVQFYPYSNPTAMSRKVFTSFDISYEED